MKLVSVTYRQKCLIEILDIIRVIISTKKYDTIVFQLVQAFGTGKGFVNFVYNPVNFDKAIRLPLN